MKAEKQDKRILCKDATVSKNLCFLCKYLGFGASINPQI